MTRGVREYIHRFTSHGTHYTMHRITQCVMRCFLTTRTFGITLHHRARARARARDRKTIKVDFLGVDKANLQK